LLTVGHGTLEAAELISLLRQAEVVSLVDIRIAPGSRRSPHVRREEMARWLPAAGIAYRWERNLGGFRQTSPASLNPALRNSSFRGYADYMQTEPFWLALDGVRASAEGGPLAVMCSESVWWRCHRRLVADGAVLARSTPVLHLMHDGRLVDHQITAGARLADGGLVRYDAGNEQLFD
jgi:uncharacterized protein (DUF488 family)